MNCIFDIQRGKRSDLDEKTAQGMLLIGEPWLITDENALAVATACNDYIVLQDKAIWFGEEIDCQSDPDYPAARAGETRRVSFPGKIGGTNGVSVTKNALILCHHDSDEGSQEQVGQNWIVINDTTQLQHSALAGRDEADAHPQYVQTSLFGAHSILKADTDDTPAALEMSPRTILARLATGDIKAASVAETVELLNCYAKSKVGTLSRDLNTNGSGDQFISVGGFTPKAFVLFWTIGLCNDPRNGFGLAGYDGSAYTNAVLCKWSSTNDYYETTMGRIIDLFIDVDNYNRAVVKAFGADGITLTWEKCGTTNTTVNGVWLAMG